MLIEDFCSFPNLNYPRSASVNSVFSLESGTMALHHSIYSVYSHNDSKIIHTVCIVSCIFLL